MDLSLYTRVARRWWVVIVVGVGLAVLLALAATFRVGGDGIELRSDETWAAQQDVLLTERGFPLGRASPSIAATSEDGTAELTAELQGSARLIDLASVYAQLSSSDQVIGLMEEEGSVDGTLSALQFTTPDGRSGLPMIRLEALATSESAAVELVRRNAAAFKAYTQRRQAAADIPPDERVVLTTVRAASSGELVSSRSIVTPVVVFLGVLVITFGVVFLLENLSRTRSAGAGGDAPPDGTHPGIGGAALGRPQDARLPDQELQGVGSSRGSDHGADEGVSESLRDR